ncbi:GlsB/YeaQ/YmgE family stress response membrane protein [Solwaraspora sp. WMMA2065]|uniref:GlsB/YeaQ/YmgE family stress response membrane protein n=1 Tax=Solwaraspora sp. WMMA2065 TaxID=3015166 RepID=UPI00259B153C|nr:GlsB/YeaQ/YmgE family stress response membrane protein [Solwaraspora sp. WMMA2065]WJK34836.1 GlsB/YeaQ/YmgE family stress response membrane protein [Solwaraspora sp. WMMA2065]WJK34868.1 GlsB/YeaQ/YmgE family stress response membrane protein [Solwaraspora sp. WMMA2065]
MIGTILWALVAGAIIGALGRLLLPGRQNISVWLTIGVGIAAALLGGVIAAWLGIGETAGIDWLRHAIQVALAVFFVWIAARVTGHRPTDAPRRATR